MGGMTHPIREWRERSGFGAVAFAKAVGVSYRTLHRIERGKAVPSLRVAEAVARVTGGAVTVRALIEHESERRGAA